MTLRVEHGKGQRDRDVMLSPRLLQLLREWWKAARPPVWLFPGQNPINPVNRPTAQSRRRRHQKLGWNRQARFSAYAAALPGL
jgi:integrase/recombinase XerD